MAAVSINVNIEKISIKIFEHRDRIPGIGLLNGKMGLCINLYQIAKYTGDKTILSYADGLIDEIYSFVDKQTPSHFINGLSGLGWGIEHLVQNNFVEADTHSILSDIDNRLFFQKAFKSNNLRLDLYEGFLGSGCYFIKRLQNSNSTDDSLSTLLLKQHLIGIIEQLDVFRNHAKEITREPDGIARYWTLPMIILFLCDVLKLDIYNSRVNKITEWLLEGVVNNIPTRQYSKLLLSLAVKKLANIRISDNASNVYELLKQINKERLLLEIQESNENKLGNSLDVLKIYYNLICIGETQLVTNELSFWKEMVLKQLISPENFPNSQTCIDEAKSLGFLDGFNGFDKILPILNI